MAKNIYEAINEVMGKVGYVQKERTGGLTYSFAGEAALIAALRPPMVESGIVMYVQDITDVNTRGYTSKSGASMTNVSLTATVVFSHAESGTFISVKARGEGADNGDKANNKAMTCAFKYAIRQTFMIETGDDPDQHPSGDVEGYELTIEKARQMTTEKGTKIGDMTKEQLDTVIEKAAKQELRDAAKLVLKTDFNME